MSQLSESPGKSERAPDEGTESFRDVQLATLNILDDFNAEKARLEETQRAVLNILEDFDSEKSHLETTQRATFNILDDFNAEKTRLEETQRAVLNILEDFDSEKSHLETTQRATFNILDDFNAEKTRLEETQRALLNILDDFEVEKNKVDQTNALLQIKSQELNRSNEELLKAHDVLELRVRQRTAQLETSNSQLRAEMEERRRAEAQVKASLAEKEALLKEIHHRVKNNLQIIHSMLNLQLPQFQDQQAVELFKESQNRVYSMALIHEKLYQSESLARIDLPDYIQSLAANLFISYGVSGNAIVPKISVEEISFDIDTAIPCALVINELVTNALKHAFPASYDGGAKEIRITLRHAGSREFVLTVGDNGVGLPEGFDVRKGKSLGLKLVNVLVRQLGGAMSVKNGCGTEFAISFPAKRGGEE